jgi:hypothetical protein
LSLIQASKRSFPEIDPIAYPREKKLLPMRAELQQPALAPC